jgi:hypothetical protein
VCPVLDNPPWPAWITPYPELGHVPNRDALQRTATICTEMPAPMPALMAGLGDGLETVDVSFRNARNRRHIKAAGPINAICMNSAHSHQNAVF